VIILHEGKLLASGEMNKLMSKSNLAVVAEIRAPLIDIKNWASNIELENSEFIEQKNGYVRCRFSGTKNNDAREQIFATVNERGWELRELSRHTPSLEDLFVSLTNGKEGNR
jgi:ABC-type multidrug transport system ATPase subunit